MSHKILEPGPTKDWDGSRAAYREFLFIVLHAGPWRPLWWWWLERRHPPHKRGCKTCAGAGRVITGTTLAYFGVFHRIIPCPDCQPKRHDWISGWDLFWVAMTFWAALAWMLYGMGL